MKKTQILALLLSLILVLTLVPVPGFATETDATDAPESFEDPSLLDVDEPSVLYGPHSADGRYPMLGSDNRLGDTGAAILYEVGSDTLVYTWQPDAAFAPSSLVKIMTALLAIENGALEEEVTVTRRVLDTVDISALIAGLYHEEVVTLEQLLYLMLVGSANDAAAVIADHVAGNQDSFVALMNERARELGCTGTNFTNAHGLHADSQVTTARDMVKILDKALEYPVFVEIFGTTAYTLPETNKSEARNFYTSNYLGSQAMTTDYYDSRVTGGRTGNTNDGHRNLAVTATVEGTTYLVVILEAKSQYATNGAMTRHGAFEDAVELLDLGFRQCARAQVLYAGQSLQQLPVTNGANDVVIGPQTDISCVLPKDLDPALLSTRVRLDVGELTSPVEAGMAVGQCQVFYDGLCIANVELYTLNGAKPVPASSQSVQTPQPGQDPGFDPGSLLTALAVLGGIFLVVLVLGGGLILFRRLSARNRQKKKTLKRRQDRRRSK